MKRNMYQLIGLAMVLTFGMAAFAATAPAAEQTLTGTVACSSKVEGHFTCKKNQPLQSCTLACIEQGGKYELVVDNDTAYLLQGDKAGLDQFAGGKASVTGVVAASEISVMSVSKATKHAHFEPMEQPTSEARLNAAK